MRIEEKEYTKSIDLSIWKKIFPFLAPRKNTLIMVVLMNLLCSVVDIIMPLFQRHAIDSFIEKNTLSGLGGFILLYIAVIVFQMCTVICFTRGCMKIDVETGRDMKRVAYISADSPDIADLRTSNLIHSLTKDRYQLLNHRVFGNMGKGGSCSDENVTGIHQPDPPDFLNIPDTYQRCSCHFPFTYFNQNITSAGNYPCIRMLLQKQNCLFYGFCVIIIFDIVHSSCPLSQISPAFVKPSISLCGVRGISANPIPVACKTALRIAGAPGIAGGSPRALFP